MILTSDVLAANIVSRVVSRRPRRFVSGSVKMESHRHLSLLLLPTPWWEIARSVSRRRWMYVIVLIAFKCCHTYSSRTTCPNHCDKTSSSKPFFAVLPSAVISMTMTPATRWSTCPIFSFQLIARVGRRRSAHSSKPEVSLSEVHRPTAPIYWLLIRWMMAM